MGRSLMKKPSLRDRKSKLRLIGRDCSQHARLDRVALPPKFSYRKKPFTLTVPVLFTKCCCTTAELLGDAIRQYIELTGIAPFDWEHISPVPEAYQSWMKRPDDVFYGVYFGFDTMDDALAAKANFDAINRYVIITTEAEEREALRRYGEQIEKESDERPTYDGGDGRGELYWRDHPYFQAGWRDYLEHVRRERTALPEKFSQPERPITLHLPVMFTKSLGSIEEQLADAIRDFTEVVGIDPFDWEHISPVPETCQSQMRAPDDVIYRLRFGFDTMDEALAAKASLEAIDCHVGVITEEGEPQSLWGAPQTDGEEEQPIT
jgi:hypothetical protein